MRNKCHPKLMVGEISKNPLYRDESVNVLLGFYLLSLVYILSQLSHCFIICPVVPMLPPQLSLNLSSYVQNEIQKRGSEEAPMSTHRNRGERGSLPPTPVNRSPRRHEASPRPTPPLKQYNLKSWAKKRNTSLLTVGIDASYLMGE